MEDVERAVAAAREAFDDGRWSGLTHGTRASILEKLATTIEAHAAELAELESQDTGKPIKLGRDSDLPFSIDNLHFFAGAARQLAGTAASEYSGGHTSIIRREPIGVVASLAPWNYPFMMAAWKIGPALAAGNTVVIKPSVETDRKSTRLNSSHTVISYAVFCLKKKKKNKQHICTKMHVIVFVSQPSTEVAR